MIIKANSRPLVVVAAAYFIAATAPVSYAATKLKTDKDKISYMIGHQIGSNFKRDGLEIDVKMFQNGINEALAGEKSPLTPEESQALMQNLQKEMQGKMAAKQKAEGEKNETAGKEFLKANAKKPGVKTTKSGLQYKVITEGKGESPKASDKVTTNYRGTLIDGTEFDSSYKRGEPASFNVGGVIPGWTEALQLMKPGSKWQLWVPPELGYGANGAGDMIGPQATLAFEVELLKIDKAEEKKK